jgi:hypothetical protein
MRLFTKIFLLIKRPILGCVQEEGRRRRRFSEQKDSRSFKGSLSDSPTVRKGNGQFVKAKRKRRSKSIYVGNDNSSKQKGKGGVSPFM